MRRVGRTQESREKVTKKNGEDDVDGEINPGKVESKD